MKKTNRFAAALLCLVFAAVGALQAQEREYIDPRAANDEGVLPFSGAVLVGDTLYISGTLGLIDEKIPADPADEARAVLDAVKLTLEKAGMTMDDIVSVQVFSSDLEQYGVFNDIYRTYFTKEFPARAFIGSGELLFGARFEVQATAVKR